MSVKYMNSSSKALSKVLNYFSTAICNNGVSHAYLLSGGSAHLRREAAFQIAALLNCTAVEEGRACGNCEACKKVEGGTHPDLYTIEPEGASIKISQVRKLQKDLGYKKYEGKYKVIIIEEAAKMTTEAANCLLKILEEPLGFTVFLLLAEQKQNMLPTILSRCQHMYLGLHDEFVPIEDFDQYISKLLSKDKLQAIELAEEVQKNDDNFLQSFLSNLLRWYRDRMVWEEIRSEKLLFNSTWLSSLKKCEITAEGCIAAIEKITAAQKNLESNANKLLTLESLFLELTALR